jgi:hypothetical protein
MEGDPERLEHRPLLVGNVIGNRHETALRPDHVTSQGAIDAMAGEPQMETEVGPPCHALFACQARYGGVDRDSLPGSGAGLDDRRELMTQDEAVVEEGVTDCSFPKPVGVGPAKTHRQHPQQYLPL